MMFKPWLVTNSILIQIINLVGFIFSLSEMTEILVEHGGKDVIRIYSYTVPYS